LKKFTLLICQGIVLLFSLVVGCNIKEEEIIETVPTTEQSIPPPPITPKPLPTPE
jgi:hypothetical protein